MDVIIPIRSFVGRPIMAASRPSGQIKPAESGLKSLLPPLKML